MIPTEPQAAPRSPQAFRLRSAVASFQMGVIWIPVSVIAWAVPVNLLLPEEAIDPVLIPTGILIALWGIWRTIGISLVIDDRGITASNFFRTYGADWPEIERIEAYNAHGPLGTAVGFTLRRSGWRNSITAAATLPGGDTDAKQSLLDLLHREARERGIEIELALDGTKFRHPLDVRPDHRGEGGQTSTEYLGIVALVAAIVVVLVGVGPQIAAAVGTGIKQAACRVAGGSCEGAASAETSGQARLGGGGPGLVVSRPDDDGHGAGEGTGGGGGGAWGGDGDDFYSRWCSLRGCFATLRRNATGAIVLLYELCNEDIDCVAEELRRYGPDDERFLGAIDSEDDLEDLEGEIREVREEGGCLNIQGFKLGGGVNWSTRGAGDSRCTPGDPFTVRSEDLEQFDGARIFEARIGEEGQITFLGQVSTEILLGYSLCGVDCVAEQLRDRVPGDAGLFPEVWRGALDDDQLDDLARAMEEAGPADETPDTCLTLTVTPGASDPYDWSSTAESGGGCAAGDSILD